MASQPDVATILRDLSTRLQDTSARTTSLLLKEARFPCHRWSEGYADKLAFAGRYYSSKMKADAQELSRLSQYLTSSRSNGSQDYRRRQAAEKVFGTAELLEQVLSSDLTIRDLLNAMQVSRGFRDSILGSPQLLRSMGLLLDSADNTYSGFARSGLFNEFYSFRTSLLPSLHDATMKLVAFFEEGVQLPALGPRSRSMRICYPPITELVMQSSCCSQEWKVLCPDGVTVGCIHDETDRIQQSHRLCPFAMPADHNSDGTVRVHVLFFGNIIRREDDCVAERQRRTLGSVNSKLWSLDVNHYIRAKKDGRLILEYYFRWVLTA